MTLSFPKNQRSQSHGIPRLVATRTGFLKQAAWLTLIALAPAVLATMLHPRAPAWTREGAGVAEVAAAWVQARADRVLWIDARNEAAFRRDGIAGAILLNEDRWDDMLPEFVAAWHPGAVVVVYCDRHCNSSQEVARRLRREMQIDNVVVLRGGREAWPEGAR